MYNYELDSCVHDNEMYVECDHVYRHNGSKENTLYLVDGNFFTQCEEDKNNDEIERWGDEHPIMETENQKKLENKIAELKMKN